MATTLLLSVVEPSVQAQNGERLICLILSQPGWWWRLVCSGVCIGIGKACCQAPGKWKQGNERYAPHLRALRAHARKPRGGPC